MFANPLISRACHKVTHEPGHDYFQKKIHGHLQRVDVTGLPARIRLRGVTGPDGDLRSEVIVEDMSSWQRAQGRLAETRSDLLQTSKDLKTAERKIDKLNTPRSSADIFVTDPRGIFA